MRFLAALLLFSLLFAACLPEEPPEPDGLPECTWAPVKRVTDGDTIVVAYGGRDERVRYIGIDTPEVAGSPVGEQPFGPAAKARNEELLRAGRACLERDITERDRFGRLLRYVWNEDGELVNEVLLREGLARMTTYPPDVKYVESRYRPAQVEAQEEFRGMWQ